MELLQFTEQARCAIHALTKAIEGFGKAGEPKIIQFATEEGDVFVRADLIESVGTEGALRDSAGIITKSGHLLRLKGVAVEEVVRQWKEGLKNG